MVIDLGVFGLRCRVARRREFIGVGRDFVAFGGSFVPFDEARLLCCWVIDDVGSGDLDFTVFAPYAVRTVVSTIIIMIILFERSKMDT